MPQGSEPCGSVLRRALPLLRPSARSMFSRRLSSDGSRCCRVLCPFRAGRGLLCAGRGSTSIDRRSERFVPKWLLCCRNGIRASYPFYLYWPWDRKGRARRYSRRWEECRATATRCRFRCSWERGCRRCPEVRESLCRDFVRVPRVNIPDIRWSEGRDRAGLSAGVS